MEIVQLEFSFDANVTAVAAKLPIAAHFNIAVNITGVGLVSVRLLQATA